MNNLNMFRSPDSQLKVYNYLGQLIPNEVPIRHDVTFYVE